VSTVATYMYHVPRGLLANVEPTSNLYLRNCYSVFYANSETDDARFIPFSWYSFDPDRVRVESCYWYGPDPASVLPEYFVDNQKSLDEITTKTTFDDWDFETTWVIYESLRQFPKLRIKGYVPVESAEELNEIRLTNDTTLIPISSIDELQLIGNSASYPSNGRYYLTQNIDASDTATWNSDGPIYRGFIPIRLTRGGSFDGRNATISNLHIEREETSKVALFSEVSDAVVKNLTIDNSDIKGYSRVSAIVGLLLGTASVLNCHTSNSTILGLDDSIGGVVGYILLGRNIALATVDYCTVTNCTITGHAFVGGVIGGSSSADLIISRCSSIGGTISSSMGIVSGLISFVSCYDGKKISITKCFSTSAIHKTANPYPVYGLSGLVDIFMKPNGSNSSTFLEFSECYFGGTLTTAGGHHKSGLVGRITEDSGSFIIEGKTNYWDGTISGATVSEIGSISTTTLMKSGTFSETIFDAWDQNFWVRTYGYYPQFSAYTRELEEFKLLLNDKYILLNNINMEAEGFDNWLPIGSEDDPFTGIFDGNKHTIRSFSSRQWVDYVGLFGYLSTTSQVRDLAIANDCIPISSPEDFYKISIDPAYPADGCYYLTNDIDLTGYEHLNVRLQNGSFDGRGFKISNLEVDYDNGTNRSYGLFYILYGNTTVKNLGVENVNLKSPGRVGALCGIAFGNILIENCYSTGSIGLVTGFIPPSTGGTYHDWRNTEMGGLIGSVTFTSCDRVKKIIIKNCFSTCTVESPYCVNMGGLIGKISPLSGSSVIVEECFASGDVLGYSNVGGLIGGIEQSGSDLITQIKNCYSLGSVDIHLSAPVGSYRYTRTNFGGLVGSIISSSDSIQNCYSCGSVSGITNVHGLIGSGGLSGTNVFASYWNTTTSGIPTGTDGIPLTDAQMQDLTNFTGWGETKLWEMIDVSGTYPRLVNTPQRADVDLSVLIPISTLEEFQKIGVDPSYHSNGKYELLNDIDCSGGVWEPINLVNGYFNGNNHTLSNLVIANTTATDYIGVFSHVYASVLKNLVVDNVSVTATDFNDAGTRIGVLVGIVRTNSIVDNCRVTNSFGNGIKYVGGIAGRTWRNISITNCQCNNVALQGFEIVGGIVGETAAPGESSYIENCSFIHGSISATNGGYAGGIVSKLDCNIANCYAEDCTIYALGSHVGGAFGKVLAGCQINNCFVDEITINTAGTYVGGFIGLLCFDISVSNCFCNTDIETGGTAVGGFIGYSGGGNNVITNCYSTGVLTPTTAKGFIYGCVPADGTKIISSYWDITTSTKTTSFLGEGRTSAQLVDQDNYSGWDFINVWNKVPAVYPTLMLGNPYGAAIIGKSNVGVLCGKNSGRIDRCCVINVIIQSFGNNAGGLCGYSDGSIQNCYAESISVKRNTGDGSILSNEYYYAGGLVGLNYGRIYRCYSHLPYIIGGIINGGLVGENYGFISQCYSKGGLVRCKIFAGGLVGRLSYGGSAGLTSGSVTDCFSVTNVIAESGGLTFGTSLDGRGIGGLIGHINNSSCNVINCYSVGKVSYFGTSIGSTLRGGLIGTRHSSSTIVNSYWNESVSARTISAGGTGRADFTEMDEESEFSDWNFDTVWYLLDTDYLGATSSYPLLRWSINFNTDCWYNEIIDVLESDEGSVIKKEHFGNYLGTLRWDPLLYWQTEYNPIDLPNLFNGDCLIYDVSNIPFNHAPMINWRSGLEDNSIYGMFNFCSDYEVVDGIRVAGDTGVFSYTPGNYLRHSSDLYTVLSNDLGATSVNLQIDPYSDSPKLFYGVPTAESLTEIAEHIYNISKANTQDATYSGAVGIDDLKDILTLIGMDPRNKAASLLYERITKEYDSAGEPINQSLTTYTPEDLILLYFRYSAGDPEYYRLNKGCFPLYRTLKEAAYEVIFEHLNSPWAFGIGNYKYNSFRTSYIPLSKIV